MKPVNLNQLLFQPKSPSLSFFWVPLGYSLDLTAFDAFYDDLLVQLQVREFSVLGKLVTKMRASCKKIIKTQPLKSHGFFFSENIQGYVLLQNPIEPYSLISVNFHTRPLLEELFVNPEFILINVSLYDIKIYRGDFNHLEIVQQYEFDALPLGFGDQKNSRVFAPQYLGMVPYKSIMAIKNIAQKIMDIILYQSNPVIVTGLLDVKTHFMRYFHHEFGVISHLEEDFYEKTCVEILEKCKNFRGMVMDYYSAQLKERLKRMMKSKRVLTDLPSIIKAIPQEKILHLVIPSEKKLWGKINFETGEYELHKKALKKEASVDILNEIAEEVMKHGGNIQILGPHFFPADSEVLAIVKG